MTTPPPLPQRPTFVTHLECSLTGERYPADEIHGLSSAGKPLLVRYDLQALREYAPSPDALRDRPEDIWSYREFLPIRRAENIVSLGENWTPLLRTPQLGENLWIKEEGRLPTGSFKARGLCLAVSMAKELGIRRIAMPTNGNAGAALAAYGSRAGMETVVFCPEDTPEVNVREIALQGAKVWRVNGLITDCGKIVREGAEEMGWFDMSTLKEPYRIEGKKTMGLELAEQFGWKLPDVIFYPTGGGTGLIGMWKAFQELAAIGWIDPAKMPRMIAVQAEGCAPMVRAFERGEEFAEPWENAHTVAVGIRVPVAVGDFLILQTVRESGGFAMAVSDEAIETARTECGEREGILLCPEGAATLAAYRKAVADGLISSADYAVLFNCGSGLKYPMPEAEAFLDHTTLTAETWVSLKHELGYGDAMSTNDDHDDDVEELKANLALDEDAALEKIEEQKNELRSILDRMQGMMEEMTDAGAKGADKVKQQLDELKLQLALGKMETRDKLDEQREKLSKAVSATKDGLDDLGDKASGKWQDATEAMNTQWKKLRPRLDALKLNMALGAAYAGDELDRRKEQLGTKLGEWKRKLQEEKEPVKNAVAEVGEDLKEAGADLVAGLKAFFKGDSEKDDDKEEDQTDTTESS